MIENLEKKRAEQEAMEDITSAQLKRIKESEERSFMLKEERRKAEKSRREIEEEEKLAALEESVSKKQPYEFTMQERIYFAQKHPEIFERENNAGAQCFIIHDPIAEAVLSSFFDRPESKEEPQEKSFMDGDFDFHKK